MNQLNLSPSILVAVLDVLSICTSTRSAQERIGAHCTTDSATCTAAHVADPVGAAGGAILSQAAPLAARALIRIPATAISSHLGATVLAGARTPSWSADSPTSWSHARHSGLRCLQRRVFACIHAHWCAMQVQCLVDKDLS